MHAIMIIMAARYLVSRDTTRYVCAVLWPHFLLSCALPAHVVAICPVQLRLFATSDTLGVIKLWDEGNALIAELQLCTPVYACCWRGGAGADLLVNAMHQIQRVPCLELLPARFKRRLDGTQVCLDIHPPLP